MIAFVVVASVFAFSLIVTGLFTSEKSTETAKATVENTKSTMTPKGSVILEQAISKGSPSIAGTPTLMTDLVNGDFIVEGVSDGDTIRNVTDGSSGVILSFTATTVTTDANLQGGKLNTWATTDTYEIDMDSTSNVKSTVIPSPTWRTFQTHFQNQGAFSHSNGG